ncbi:MAG: hypothetical protein Kow009_09830 [Spirochaetales bacterium]
MLRNLLWLFLFYHWYLHFQEYLAFWPVILLWAGSIGLGTLVHRAGKRTSIGHPVKSIRSLLITGMIPFLLYYSSRWLFLLAATGFGSDPWDLLLLALDRYFFFMILPVELLSLTTLLIYRSSTASSMEPALLGLLFAALFFPEGEFRNHLYPHPLPFGIAISLFLIGEFLLLILTGREAEHDSPVLPWHASSFGRFKRSLPYLAVLLLALYAGYDRYTAWALEARGGLLKADLFRFDFTHYLTLETEIRQTRDLVLLYRRSEPVDRYLLKRYLLEGYVPGKGFFKDPLSPDPAPGETVSPQSQSFPLRETRGRKSIQQELYIVNLDPQALITLDYPLRIIPYRTWPDSSFSRVYRVDAMALTILPLELSEVDGPGMDQETLSYYTKYGEEPRIRMLAEEITRGIPTYYDKVQAISDYLRYDYFYSLRPGKAPDGDQLGYFLFTSRKGYCSYFAFSMALLCRSLGIPARVAIGFFIDPQTELLGFYPVRSDMAHAWVEVYFDGYGWVDFDPTSRTPAPGESFLPNERPNREDIASLLKEILSHPLEAGPIPPDGRERMDEGTHTIGLEAYRTLARIVSFALFPLAIGLLILIRFRYGLKSRIQRSSRGKAHWAFWALLQDLAPLGFVPSPSRSLEESLETFLANLDAKESLPFHPSRASLQELFFLYQKAKFSASFDKNDLDQFFEVLDRTRRELYRQTHPFLRMLLRWHPSSFRRPV